MNKPTVSLRPRRKADFLPRSFVSAEFDAAILKLLIHCFKTMLITAHRRGDAAWNVLVEMLYKHELLVVKVPQEVDFPSIAIAVPGRDETLTSEARTLSYGFEHFQIEMDRKRLDKPAYLTETASVLAYMFCWRLFTRPLEGMHIALFHLDAHGLHEFMRLHHRAELNLDTLSKFLIARVVEQELVKRGL